MRTETFVRVWIEEEVDGHIDLTRSSNIYTWLAANIGDRGYEWDYTEDASGNYLDFHSNQDADLFVIAWKGQTRPA